MNLQENDHEVGTETKATTKKKSNLYSSNVNRATDQIIRSVQDVIKVSKNNEFKQKCLDVVDAEDFEEFERKTKKRLTKMLKSRRSGIQNRESVIQSQSVRTENRRRVEGHNNRSIQRLHNKTSYSPIRKRTRKEPLTQLPLNVPQNSHSCKIQHNIDKEIVKDTDTFNIADVTLNRVDVSLLCDFIEGTNNRLVEWLGNENEASVPSATKTDQFTASVSLCKSTAMTSCAEEVLASYEECDNVSIRRADICDKLLEKAEKDSEIRNKSVEKMESKHAEAAVKSDDDLEVMTYEITLKKSKSFDEDLTETEISFNCLENAGIFASATRNAPDDVQTVPTMNDAAISDDWLREYEDDEFWGKLSSSPTVLENIDSENFNLESKELFCVDEKLIVTYN